MIGTSDIREFLFDKSLLNASYSYPFLSLHRKSSFCTPCLAICWVLLVSGFLSLTTVDLPAAIDIFTVDQLQLSI
jgi:hypothetical protein